MFNIDSQATIVTMCFTDMLHYLLSKAIQDVNGKWKLRLASRIAELHRLCDTLIEDVISFYTCLCVLMIITCLICVCIYVYIYVCVCGYICLLILSYSERHYLI